MNPTNDPKLRSFVAVADDSPFPIQNLPYGVFRHGNKPPRIGTAIGEYVLDLNELARAGLLRGGALGEGECFFAPELNPFLAMGRLAWQTARERLSNLLRDDVPTLRDDASLRDRALIPISEVTMELPVRIGNYTDFYSSKEHATNVGTMFRGKDNALMPNWVHLPVAYHGRASSVVPGGVPVRRPCGQALPQGSERPVFRPTQALDFELEMGYFVGPGNQLGTPIPARRAKEHVFGMVIVNDWSARDIQRWEYQPLGPFLSKSFATSISPWVVTLAALEPFLTDAPRQDPLPLEYLRHEPRQIYDIELEVLLQAADMPEPITICRSNNKYLYWTIEQQVAHHTCNGCNLQPGDLLATGTISGPDPTSYGSLLELTWRGERPIQLPTGQSRVFLQDGDRVTMRAWCRGPDYAIGFGEVTAEILPAE